MLVRALKDASRKDWPYDKYSSRSDKTTPADKATAEFFLHKDKESLRFWTKVAGIELSVFEKFLRENKLDSDEARAKLKLGAWDKGQYVRSNRSGRSHA